jgi:hypothetical protein
VHSTTGACSGHLAGCPEAEFNDERELIKVLDMVIGAVIALIAAVMAVFLILLAINIALVRKLRSIIPHAPRAGHAAGRIGGRERTRRD